MVVAEGKCFCATTCRCRPSAKCVYFSEAVEQIIVELGEKIAIHRIAKPFLALFDYVSRVNKIKICSSSIRPSFVHRQFRYYFWIHDFFEVSIDCCSRPHFEISNLKGLTKTLKFSLTWDPIEMKISNRYYSHNYSFSASLFLNVPLLVLAKITYSNFEN